MLIAYWPATIQDRPQCHRTRTFFSSFKRPSRCPSLSRASSLAPKSPLLAAISSTTWASLTTCKNTTWTSGLRDCGKPPSKAQTPSSYHLPTHAVTLRDSHSSCSQRCSPPLTSSCRDLSWETRRNLLLSSRISRRQVITVWTVGVSLIIL